MEHNHIIGMVCGYYLSRFDKRAYKRWGFTSKKEAHRKLGQRLDVPPKSIENWRDEFDPIHDNPRKGWHKREMAPSRRRVVEVLGDLSEAELFSILRLAIESPGGEIAQTLVESVSEPDTDERDKVFRSRGITGKKAEDLFIAFHQSTGRPVAGELKDRRYDGCGYDFEIAGHRKTSAVEVKGLSGIVGGISFTDKEWSTAQDMANGYYLVVVRNVIIRPVFYVVQNPAVHFEPRSRTYTTLHLSYSVSGQCLADVGKSMMD